MAHRVQVVLVDDLDGGEARETVKFAVDGTPYEIDLNEQNAARLREALAPFVKKGRKSSAPQRSRKRAGKTQEVREWAKAHGIPVNGRGRIPARVMEQYQKSA
jgi:hypothetical protein